VFYWTLITSSFLLFIIFYSTRKLFFYWN
jgi:hypothetical protein